MLIGVAFMNEIIAEKLDKLPQKPGVYMMKDASGRIIYVGKAKNLKRRVSSYFNKNPDSAKFAAFHLDSLTEDSLQSIADLTDENGQPLVVSLSFDNIISTSFNSI